MHGYKVKCCIEGHYIHFLINTGKECEDTDSLRDIVSSRFNVDPSTLSVVGVESIYLTDREADKYIDTYSVPPQGERPAPFYTLAGTYTTPGVPQRPLTPGEPTTDVEGRTRVHRPIRCGEEGCEEDVYPVSRYLCGPETSSPWGCGHYFCQEHLYAREGQAWVSCADCELTIDAWQELGYTP